MRAIVDTNVLVSGLLSPAGAPGKIVDVILKGWLIPLVSAATLAELEDVLARPGILKFFTRSGIDSAAFLADYRAVAQTIEPHPSTLDIRDKKDRIFLDLAEGSPSEVILVTGDRDFHAIEKMHHRVMTPKNFAEAFLTPITLEDSADKT